MVNDTTVSNPALGPVLEKTKKYLRSTLLSHKGGVEMYALDNDYYEMVGEKIPYQKLNFASLESLLRALPSVCSLQRYGGEVMVSGVAGEASQHIQNMVAMQKTTVKGKSRKRGVGKKSGRYGQLNYDRWIVCPTTTESSSQLINTGIALPIRRSAPAELRISCGFPFRWRRCLGPGS